MYRYANRVSDGVSRGAVMRTADGRCPPTGPLLGQVGDQSLDVWTGGRVSPRHLRVPVHCFRLLLQLIATCCSKTEQRAHSLLGVDAAHVLYRVIAHTRAFIQACCAAFMRM